MIKGKSGDKRYLALVYDARNDREFVVTAFAVNETEATRFVKNKLRIDYPSEHQMLIRKVALDSKGLSCKVNKSEKIAVDRGYKWQSMNNAPLGVKLQLLTVGGIAVHGTLTKQTKHHYVGFTPLPKSKNEAKNNRR